MALVKFLKINEDARPLFFLSLSSLAKSWGKAESGLGTNNTR
jgi:hypothetical protein